MQLDYRFHVLKHFHPRRADGDLRRRVKGRIRELSVHSVRLLEGILELAEAGCEEAPHAATEYMHPPGKEGAVDPAPEFSADEVALVEMRVWLEYSGELEEVAAQHELLKGELTMRLSLDARGAVTSQEVRLPEGVEIPDFLADLERRIARWQFPEITRAGSCTVQYQIGNLPRPDDWHMCEYMLRPRPDPEK